MHKAIISFVWELRTGCQLQPCNAVLITSTWIFLGSHKLWGCEIQLTRFEVSLYLMTASILGDLLVNVYNKFILHLSIRSSRKNYSAGRGDSCWSQQHNRSWFRAPQDHILRLWESWTNQSPTLKLKLIYNRWSVGQSVLVLGSHLGHATNFFPSLSNYF
jgi:hypothetical protein